MGHAKAGKKMRALFALEVLVLCTASRCASGFYTGIVSQLCLRGTPGFTWCKGSFGPSRCRLQPAIRLTRDDSLEDSVESFPEGEELARELFETVRLRKFRAELEAAEQKAEEEKKRAMNNRAFVNRKEVRGGKDIQDVPPFPPRIRSDVNRRIEYEFGLVDRASSERIFLVQAALILLVFSFYIYVGMTGGITSPDPAEFSIIDSEYEILPTPDTTGTTSAASFWI